MGKHFNRQQAEAIMQAERHAAAVQHAARMLAEENARVIALSQKKNQLAKQDDAYAEQLIEQQRRRVILPRSLTPHIDQFFTHKELASEMSDQDVLNQLEMRDNIEQNVFDENEDDVDQDYEDDEDDENMPQQFREGGAVHVAPLKETGIIEGPGKGQDDVIATSVPEKSYIIDASSVSDLGDGSSEAGAAVFDAFFKNLRRQHGIDEGAHNNAQEVPVYLSNDEYLIDESDVTLLGGGDNNKGAKLLKAFVKNIRKHKNSNGLELPPKAKSIEQYFPKKI